MTRRFIEDESGMTMALAIMVMVIIGVMGAGLLTFVTTDLTAVAEVNQGQKAFEMADAGVQAAKRQLASDSRTDRYDGNATDNLQWAFTPPSGVTQTGMTMNNLDDSATTADSVNVTIEYRPTTTDFRVISTGTHGDAKRKIEAIFRAYSGIPAYYTPGGMQINKDNTVNGLSFFAGGNIELSSGYSFGNDTDPLGDWNRPPYNTTPRKDSSGSPYTKTGLAAGGYICNTVKCSSPSDSIADGIIGYDSTTRTKGNKKEFVEKSPPTGTQNTITYPFSRTPNVEGLLARAKSGLPNVYDNTAPYDILSSTTKRVHFIDAGGNTISLNKSFTLKGVLVIRCGSLDLQEKPTIEGIIMVVKGEGTGCSSTGTVDIKKDATINGYVFAESESDDAVNIDKDAKIGLPPPDEYNEFLDLAYLNSTSVTLQSWRELYQ